MIEQLPEFIIDEESQELNSEGNMCPICLSEMVVGETARKLRCDHMFHKQCVDEWLRVNASCPTCRKRIIDENSGSGSNEETNHSSHGNSSSNEDNLGNGNDIRPEHPLLPMQISRSLE